MKTSKIKIYFGIFSLLLLLTSCSDFLTETLPNDFNTNTFYQTDEEAVKGLYGLYADVRSTVFGPDYEAVTDLMCDDIDYTTTDQARS
jgi:hypothetical protein